MERFIRNFQRDAHGTWHCISPATYESPMGRIQVTPGTTFTRGTRFMNFDVAAALDEQYAKERCN